MKKGLLFSLIMLLLLTGARACAMPALSARIDQEQLYVTIDNSGGDVLKGVLLRECFSGQERRLQLIPADSTVTVLWKTASDDGSRFRFELDVGGDMEYAAVSGTVSVPQSAETVPILQGQSFRLTEAAYTYEKMIIAGFLTLIMILIVWRLAALRQREKRRHDKRRRKHSRKKQSAHRPKEETV